MRTRSSWIWCWITGAVLASSASAQVYVSLIDNLPTCIGNRNGRIISVSDATSDSDCSVGGATGDARFVHPCICDTLNALGPYWKAVGGGAGGAGVSGLDTADGGTALADNTIVRGDGATGIQGSAVTIADTTGNLQWEGTTADAFEGNFTFADPTADWTWTWGAAGDLVGAGSLSIDNLKLDGNTLSTTDTNGDLVLAPNGTGGVTHPVGSATLPGITFFGDPDNGFYWPSADAIAYASGGALQWFTTVNQLNLYNSNLVVSWGVEGQPNLRYAAEGVLGVGLTGNNRGGWVADGGKVALASDFTNATATMSNLTGLSTTLVTGRKYTFDAAFFFADSTAVDGATFDFDGGAATATSFVANCQIFDTALLLSAETTAIATDFVVATTTGASALKCSGSFVVNAAGTFIPRAAQTAHTSGTLTVKAGSFLNVRDTSFN